MVRKLAAATGRVGRWRSIDLNVSPSGDTLCREPLPKVGDADVEAEVVLRLIVRLTTPTIGTTLTGRVGNLFLRSHVPIP